MERTRKRKEWNEQLNKNLFEECSENACKTVSSGIKSAKALLEYVHKELCRLESLKKKIDEKQILLSHIKEYTELARLGNLAGTLYKNFNPDLGDAVGEQLLKELKKKEEKKLCDKAA